MAIQTLQDKFSSNDKNRVRLISMLREELENAGFSTRQPQEDADVLIVNTAIEKSGVESPVFILGEDTDLLVIMTQFGHDKTNLYFRKPGKGKTPTRTYSSNSFKFPELNSVVCFLHAFCGCDTTSCFYGRGKKAIVKIVHQDEELQALARSFYANDPVSENIAANGITIIMKLCDCKTNLHELQYSKFKKCVSKATLQLENLPPTEAAATQHCYRVFRQIHL